MRTILITGSTDGIGQLCAIKLAKDGCPVFLHGRNAGKLQKLIAEIKSSTGNDHVDGFIADFSDIATVEKMADDVLGKLDSLDVLINNAGI